MLWKQRFFVLKNTNLSYFDKKGDKVPRRVITITDKCSVVRGATRAEGFLLRGPDREMRLRADNEKEEDEWVSTLQTIIKNEQVRVVSLSCQDDLVSARVRLLRPKNGPARR
ncbi:unnamed protein product, partial [Phaeothamnion confervicola]